MKIDCFRLRVRANGMQSQTSSISRYSFVLKTQSLAPKTILAITSSNQLIYLVGLKSIIQFNFIARRSYFDVKKKIVIKLTHILIGCANWFGNTAIGCLHRKLLQMTCTAHQSTLIRITSFIRFVSQLHATFFANITIDMKIFIH